MVESRVRAGSCSWLNTRKPECIRLPNYNYLTSTAAPGIIKPKCIRRLLCKHAPARIYMYRYMGVQRRINNSTGEIRKDARNNCASRARARVCVCICTYMRPYVVYGFRGVKSLIPTIYTPTLTFLQITWFEKLFSQSLHLYEQILLMLQSVVSQSTKLNILRLSWIFVTDVIIILLCRETQIPLITAFPNPAQLLYNIFPELSFWCILIIIALKLNKTIFIRFI